MHLVLSLAGRPITTPLGSWKQPGVPSVWHAATHLCKFCGNDPSFRTLTRIMSPPPARHTQTPAVMAHPLFSPGLAPCATSHSTLRDPEAHQSFALLPRTRTRTPYWSWNTYGLSPFVATELAPLGPRSIYEVCLTRCGSRP